MYVHGLWLSGRESLFLRRRLASEFGLDVHPFHYPSVSLTMADIAERLNAFMRELCAKRTNGCTVHLIGHSLGGLVIYRFLERFPQQPSGRVVFLGTPCVESRAAARAARLGWASKLIGRTVAEELLERRERRWNAGRDLGIIAGTRRMGLGQLFAHFDEDCDGTIAVSETKLPGATDHVTLPVSHMGMLLSARVARHTGHFLAHGRFALDALR
ncbi:MAG: esterase/lipase family protein [Steroidobacteraceae bacterium]